MSEETYLVWPARPVLNDERYRVYTRYFHERYDPKNKSETIIQAASEGKIDAVKHLLNAGWDVNVQGKGGVTPLMAASYKGHVEVVELLLKNGAKVDLRDGDRATALMYSGAKDNLGDDKKKRNENAVKIAALLLKNGANIHAETQYEHTAFDCLVSDYNGVHNKELGKMFLERGAVTDDKRLFVLAAQNGYPEIIQRLLDEKRVDINEKDEDGYTALLRAAGNGHVQVVKLLLEKGANPHFKSVSGFRALDYVVESEEMEPQAKAQIKEMLQKAMNGQTHPRQPVSQEVTPQQKTVLAPQPSKEQQNTALLQACKDGKEEEAIRLLNAKANPNARGEGNSTPLMWAAYSGQIEVVKLLLEKKADVHAKDNEGKTALNFAEDFAKETGNTAVRDLLKSPQPAKDETKESLMEQALKGILHYLKERRERQKKEPRSEAPPTVGPLAHAASFGRFALNENGGSEVTELAQRQPTPPQPMKLARHSVIVAEDDPNCSLVGAGGNTQELLKAA